jgi:uncharacterized surface protein with fasciclin (FAS1) repeats
MKNSILLLQLFLFATLSVQSETIQVTAQNFSYTPANITINVGDTVVWTNNGGTHDVNGEINSITENPFNNPESFDSETTSTIGSVIYTHVFTTAGEYNYDCSVGSHAANGMVGTINVQNVIPATVFDIIAESSAHDTLEIAIIQAELVGALSGDGPFTVFAPTDAAFAAVDPMAFQAIISNNDFLTPILLHHVHAEGTVLSTDLVNGMMVSTLNEDDLVITQVNDSTFKVDDATITITDILAENGVVHVINAVLIPEIPEGTTVFDIIENSSDHTTLETALIESDLADVLSGDGPFTVFAPTDAAFDALPAGTLDALLADMPALTTLLTHHVYGGSLEDTDLTDGLSILTLNEDNLTVANDGTSIMIDDAMVTLSVNQADNGIVHIIDAVLTLEEPTSIDNLLLESNVVYMHTINLLGEKVERESNDKVLIDIYSNGTVIKRYNSNK